VTTSVTPTPPLPSTPPAQPARAELDALHAVLKAEQAAIYGYGVVGGQVARTRRKQVTERLDWHAVNRDAVTAQLSLAGALAPPGPPAYALPFEVHDDESARALAAHLELGVAAAYADLVAASGAARRAAAAEAQSGCAVAAQHWGTVVGAFPGLPERTDG
jgi:hypothetical protein